MQKLFLKINGILYSTQSWAKSTLLHFHFRVISEAEKREAIFYNRKAEKREYVSFYIFSFFVIFVSTCKVIFVNTRDVTLSIPVTFCLPILVTLSLLYCSSRSHI